MSDEQNTIEMVEEETATYPISRQAQVELWRESLEDARQLSQEYQFQVIIASAMWKYRIKILSDRVLDHDMLEMNDEELNELLENGE